MTSIETPNRTLLALRPATLIDGISPRTGASGTVRVSAPPPLRGPAPWTQGPTRVILPPGGPAVARRPGQEEGHHDWQARPLPVRPEGGAAVAIASALLVSAPHRVRHGGQDFRFVGVPSTLPAADYDTRFFNLGRAPHMVVAMNLGASCVGLSEDEVIGLLDLGPEAAGAACPDLGVNGDIFALPGTVDQGTLTLTPGRNWLVCFVRTPDGVPHYRLGMLSSVRAISIG